MNVITSVSDKYFSLNGIRYVRNYLSKPYGENIELYNCYDRKDVLVAAAPVAHFTVNGVTHSATAALQQALVDVTYNRNFGASGNSAPVVKPVKVITVATIGFIAGIYTLQPDDDKKWLVFNLPTAFTIHIPVGIFVANAEFEGETIGNGQGTFTAAIGVTLSYGASDLAKTAERYSVFGLKFRSSNEVSLFGKLELA